MKISIIHFFLFSFIIPSYFEELHFDTTLLKSTSFEITSIEIHIFFH